jgi:hypothetical protein
MKTKTKIRAGLNFKPLKAIDGESKDVNHDKLVDTISCR